MRGLLYTEEMIESYNVNHFSGGFGRFNVLCETFTAIHHRGNHSWEGVKKDHHGCEL